MRKYFCQVGLKRGRSSLDLLHSPSSKIGGRLHTVRVGPTIKERTQPRHWFRSGPPTTGISVHANPGPLSNIPLDQYPTCILAPAIEYGRDAHRI